MTSMEQNETGKFLDWDSDFFGYRIARAISSYLTQENVRLLLEWGEAQRIDCLYFLCDAEDQESVQLAQAYGFFFVDIRLTLDKPLRTDVIGYDPSAQGIIRPAAADDLKTLREIARAGHRNTRFYYDPHFPVDRCDALYETWIEKSFYGYADAVLVADVNGQAAGYISCHLLDQREEGQIGLTAVAANQQKQGLGQKLVNASLDWFGTQGVKSVSVVTQGRNVQAQRLYQRCGFLTKTVQLWYHRWLLP